MEENVTMSTAQHAPHAHEKNSVIKFTLWNILMSTKKCFFKFHFFDRNYIAFIKSRSSIVLRKVTGHSDTSYIGPLVKQHLGGTYEKNDTIIVYASFVSNIKSMDLKVFSISN